MQQQTIAMSAKLKDQTITHMNEMELNAEHMAQLALEKALKPETMPPCNTPGENPSGDIDCSLRNIKTYINTLDGLSSAEEIMPQISQLLGAIFQDEEAVQMAMMGSA